jgi:hypothetical protein
MVKLSSPDPTPWSDERVHQTNGSIFFPFDLDLDFHLDLRMKPDGHGERAEYLDGII